MHHRLKSESKIYVFKDPGNLSNFSCPTTIIMFRPILLLMSFSSIESFIAYDCANSYHAREPIDLKKVKECENFESWYPTIQDANIQVVKSKSFEEVTVYECRLFETISAHFCGQFDSISYGLPEDIKTLSPFLISANECRNLVEERRVSYRDTVFTVDSTAHFSFDKMVTGRRWPDGSCERGPEFFHRGKTYTGYAKRAVVHGQVFIRKLKFDPASKRICLLYTSPSPRDRTRSRMPSSA